MISFVPPRSDGWSRPGSGALEHEDADVVFTRCRAEDHVDQRPAPVAGCDRKGRVDDGGDQSLETDAQVLVAAFDEAVGVADQLLADLHGGDPWRAYALKEALRAVFAGDLTEDEVGELLDRFCSKASRSGLKPFVTAAKTIRKRRAGILAAERLGINNARHEGLNRRVRLIVNRAYGFHSAGAALALIMLTLGPIDHVLPHERRRGSDP